MSVFLMTLGLEAYTLWSSNPLRLDSHLKVNCGLNFNLSKTLFPYGLSKRPARCKMTVIYSCMFPSAIGKQGRFWNWNWGVRPLRPGWNYIVATQLKCYFHFMSICTVCRQLQLPVMLQCGLLIHFRFDVQQCFRTCKIIFEAVREFIPHYSELEGHCNFLYTSSWSHHSGHLPYIYYALGVLYIAHANLCFLVLVLPTYPHSIFACPRLRADAL